MTAPSVDVRHDEDDHRFVAEVAGGEAELAYAGPRSGVVTFVHTEVPRESRGAGVGEALARAGLAWAREQGLWVRPVCPYMEAFVRRHRREFGDLVEPVV